MERKLGLLSKIISGKGAAQLEAIKSRGENGQQTKLKLKTKNINIFVSKKNIFVVVAINSFEDNNGKRTKLKFKMKFSEKQARKSPRCASSKILSVRGAHKKR